MTSDQCKNLLQWRQRLDCGQEFEFMMYDNNPCPENIYLTKYPNSLWILKEVNTTSHRFKKVFRETKPGRRQPVLVLVGTQVTINELQQKLQSQQE